MALADTAAQEGNMLKFVFEVFAVALFYLVTDYFIRHALGIEVQRLDWWIGFLQGMVGCAIIFLIEGVLKQ